MVMETLNANQSETPASNTSRDYADPASLLSGEIQSSESNGSSAFDRTKFPSSLRSVMEMVPNKVQSVRNQVNMKNLKSVFTMIGVSEQKPFNVPSKHEAGPRFLRNVQFFATNYVVVLFLVLCFVLLYHPIQFLICALPMSAWYYVLVHGKKDGKHYILGDRRIGERELFIGLSASSIFVVIFFLIPTVFTTLWISGFICAVHALGRDRKVLDAEDHELNEAELSV